MIWLLIIAAALLAGYFVKNPYDYWKKRNVAGPEPKYLFGNLKEAFFMRRSLGELYGDIYNQFPDESIVGIFRGTTPILIVRDPQLLKELMVKNFASFHDNDVFLDKNVDPLLGRNPAFSRGEDWKIARSILTPNFTSGKTKPLHPLFEGMSEKMVEFISGETSKGQAIEAKDLCSRFSLNNVATCAFGLEGKCFQDPEAEYRQIARRLFNPNGFNMYKIFALQLFPLLKNFVSMRFTPKDVEKKLFNMIKSTMKYRKDNNIIRKDFLHSMIHLKEKSPEFKDLDITAYATGFFANGYETSSITMSFTLFELASNLEKQDILRAELIEKFEENDGKIPCDVLLELPYLDAVIHESLRLHPGFLLTRKCTQDYKYEMKNGQSLVIEKDITIIIPSYAMHRDEKYFEDPNRFKPERFLPENKGKLQKFTYLPFGEGHRICLGKIFGLLQIKTGLSHIIRNFKLKVNGKTQVPLKINPVAFLTSPIGGMWIDFEKI